MRCGQECLSCVLMRAVVRVDLAGQLEDGGQCVCGVQVVVHCVDELLLVALQSLQLLGLLSGHGVARCLFDAELHVVASLIQTGKGGLVHLKRLSRVVKRSAVVRAQHKHADGLIAELLCCVADHEEVALGLGHFLIVDGQEAVVQPVMREGAAVCTLGLCDLVLVMRENQIKTAGMDVDGLAEVLVRHSRALNVPARPSLTPG